MKLFGKTEAIVLKTEKQRDAYIDRLDHARVDFDLSEVRDDVYSREITYVIHIRPADLKKVG